MTKFRQKSRRCRRNTALHGAFFAPQRSFPGPAARLLGLQGPHRPHAPQPFALFKQTAAAPARLRSAPLRAYKKYPRGIRKGPPLREGPLRPKAAACSVFILPLLPFHPPRRDRSEDKRRRARLRWLRRPLPSPGRCGYRSSSARLPCRLPSASR